MNKKGFLLPEALLAIFITSLTILLMLSSMHSKVKEIEVIEKKIEIIEEEFLLCVLSINEEDQY